MTDNIPQNINFAIQAPVAHILLDANGVEYELAASEQELATADVLAKARDLTVQVECYR